MVTNKGHSLRLTIFIEPMCRHKTRGITGMKENMKRKFRKREGMTEYKRIRDIAPL